MFLQELVFYSSLPDNPNEVPRALLSIGINVTETFKKGQNNFTWFLCEDFPNHVLKFFMPEKYLCQKINYKLVLCVEK